MSSAEAAVARPLAVAGMDALIASRCLNELCGLTHAHQGICPGR